MDIVLVSAKNFIHIFKKVHQFLMKYYIKTITKIEVVIKYYFLFQVVIMHQTNHHRQMSIFFRFIKFSYDTDSY